MIFFSLFNFSILSFIFLSLTFVPMEKVFPAKHQHFFRPYFITDLFFFIGQYLFWNTAVTFILLLIFEKISLYFSLVELTTFKSQHFFIQVIEIIFISDFLIYWAHRFQHHSNFLWRFHKVHHSAEHLDWLAAYREHPIDTIYTVGIINLPAFFLGFNLNQIEFFIAFRGIWAIFIHSNVKLNLGKIQLLVGSPQIHHWHHDLNRQAGNYANLSPLFDIVFGTFYSSDIAPEKFGIKDKFSKNYFGQLIEPFFKK